MIDRQALVMAVTALWRLVCSDALQCFLRAAVLGGSNSTQAAA